MSKKTVWLMRYVEVVTWLCLVGAGTAWLLPAYIPALVAALVAFFAVLFVAFSMALFWVPVTAFVGVVFDAAREALVESMPDEGRAYWHRRAQRMVDDIMAGSPRGWVGGQWRGDLAVYCGPDGEEMHVEVNATAKGAGFIVTCFAHPGAGPLERTSSGRGWANWGDVEASFRLTRLDAEADLDKAADRRAAAMATAKVNCDDVIEAWR